MYRYLAEIFAFKKRRYLKNFSPSLNIEKGNVIRIPGDYYGAIVKKYRRAGRISGYRDQRDYFTDLALRGFDRISARGDGEVRFNVRRIYELHTKHEDRSRVAKVDLKSLNLPDVNRISQSLINIDLYDLVSVLIIAGWDEVNGGILYVKRDHEKIYS